VADQSSDMDWIKLSQKLKGALFNKKNAFLLSTCVLGVAIVVLVVLVAGPKLSRYVNVMTGNEEAGALSVSRLFKVYGKAFADVQDKVDELYRAEEDNQRLVLENAQLRHRAEALQLDCRVKDAMAATKELELPVDQETAARVNRSLSAINYSIPAYLLPQQIHTLGVTYFKAREDDKAAKIFTYLTGMMDDDIFKTPKNHLLTGIAWYRLDNFKLAEHYFDKVIGAAESSDVLGAQAQARLWKALSFERMGEHEKSQNWLRELVGNHPHSTEAAWVNSVGVERGIASDE
jgi:tetratricopeptide (TPR) repeat protein